MVGIICVFSKLMTVDQVKSEMEVKLNSLITNIDNIEIADYINSKELAGNFITEKSEIYTGYVLLVVSGGSELFIQRLVTKINKPFLLLAHPNSNSLASALESYAVLKEKAKIEIFYSELKDQILKEKLISFCRISETTWELNNGTLGCIGRPSSWLLTSQGIENIEGFGTKLKYIETENLVSEINSLSNDLVQEMVNTQKKKYGNVLISDLQLSDSLKVYLGLKSIIKKNKLTALTIRCFDLLKYKYTACLGMSLCADEGIVVGCEGDIPTAFTMMIISSLFKKQCWIVNPSRINIKEDQLTIAHCTVPSNMLDNLKESSLTTHMESGLSVAIQGPLRHVPATLVRVGDHFRKIHIATGVICNSNMGDEKLCRTQAEIVLNDKITHWMQKTLGNHQVLIYGDLMNELEYFCSLNKIEVVS